MFCLIWRRGEGGLASKKTFGPCYQLAMKANINPHDPPDKLARPQYITYPTYTPQAFPASSRQILEFPQQLLQPRIYAAGLC